MRSEPSPPAGPVIPEHPRLGFGCRWFECNGVVVVRTPDECRPLSEESQEGVVAVLGRLDGRSVSRLCLELGFEVLGVLGQLAEAGLLIEQGAREALPPLPSGRMEGVVRHRFSLEGDPSIAASLTELLGAPLSCGAKDPAQGLVEIVARVVPDLGALAQRNAAVLAGGSSWLPIVCVLDELVVGPLIRPETACWACVELRWLGLSRSVEHEGRFLEHLRGGAWREERAAGDARAGWLARAAAPLVRRLLGEEADGTLFVVSLADGTVTRHEVPRHPLCPHCAPRPAPRAVRSADFEDEPLELSRLHEALSSVSDQRFGLAALEVTPESKKPSVPGLPHIALTRFAFGRPSEVRGKQSNWTHGAAKRAEDARTLARVEALERYAGLLPPLRSRQAAFSELGDAAVCPVELPLFSDAQYAVAGFPFEPFDPKRPLSWVEGYHLSRRAVCWVPACAAHYGEDDTLVSETSSGVAAHSARSHALLNGVLEAVERDAFMIHWLHSIEPPGVAVEASRDPEVTRFVDFVAHRGWTPRVQELTTDLEVPVFLATGVRTDGRGHALIVGAGASLDAGTALVRALSELHSAVVSHPDHWTPPEPLAAENVLRAQHHQDFYGLPENLHHAEFLWRSERRVAPPRPARTLPAKPLEHVLQRLRRAGHDVVGVDLTPPDVAACGLHVMRALVLGLQPIAFGRSKLRLGGSRLYTAPERFGARSLPEARLNGAPHCFP